MDSMVEVAATHLEVSLAVFMVVVSRLVALATAVAALVEAADKNQSKSIKRRRSLRPSLFVFFLTSSLLKDKGNPAKRGIGGGFSTVC